MQDGDGTSTRYGTVCAGCLPLEGAENCSDCTIENADIVPEGCSEAPDGAVAAPGATLETLEIEPGWYRATNATTSVLRCYKEAACLGG